MLQSLKPLPAFEIWLPIVLSLNCREKSIPFDTRKVSEEELKNAKEKYIGSFVMDVQKPRTAANYALNIARYNLPKDFYANYIENINAVTIEAVQNAAIKYFRGDKARDYSYGQRN